MKNKIIEYHVAERANALNEILATEIRKKTFKQEFNLSGEVSSYGGFELYNNISTFVFRPNFGPLVKLHLISSNTNQAGSESKLILKRLNGPTFRVQFWFISFFTALTLTIAVYKIWNEGIMDKWDFLIMPSLGIVYYLFVELVAIFTIENLIKRIENILKAKKIEFKKL